MSAAELEEVHLLRLPVQLWAASQEHHDELMREFSLMTLTDEDAPGAPVPLRLLRLVQQLTTRFGGTSDGQREQLFAASAKGEQEIDHLVYRVPAAAAPALRELALLLDQADEYCRAGQHLLTLATPGELRLFRQWYLEQFTAQLEGAEPVAWPAFRSAVAAPPAAAD